VKARDDDAGRGTPEVAMLSRRRNLELARVDILARMERVQAPAHRQMLEKALAAVEKELKSIT
jgi:hypothetical protein